MDLGISGRLALVVGGSKGVGRAVSRILLDEGCRVVTVARTGDVSIHADLMTCSLTMLCREIEEKHGSPDIIYYCVGGSYGDIKDWRSLPSDYQRVWQFNLGIAIELNNYFVPHMLERKWGRVVMTSTDGTKCNSGNPPYTSSKFAVEGYVKTVSKQWSPHNVVLTAVAPGHVYTEGRWMYSQSEEWTKEYFAHHAPIGRWADNDEVAKVVSFLCSEHASYMAGSIVRVDGGSR